MVLFIAQPARASFVSAVFYAAARQEMQSSQRDTTFWHATLFIQLGLCGMGAA